MRRDLLTEQQRAYLTVKSTKSKIVKVKAHKRMIREARNYRQTKLRAIRGVVTFCNAVDRTELTAEDRQLAMDAILLLEDLLNG